MLNLRLPLQSLVVREYTVVVHTPRAKSLHDSSNDGTMNDILEMMEKESNLEDITESSKPKKFKTTH